MNSKDYLNYNLPTIAVENGLDVRELTTTGSILHINQDYNEVETVKKPEKLDKRLFDNVEQISFDLIANQLTPLDDRGYVKKKIITEGGGMPIAKDCTVSVVYSGFFEGEKEPFDVTPSKPLVIHLQDSGLLPGLQIAVESMLVGEMAVYLLSYKVMYGDLGIPPRIKPKANCVFYIRLIKSLLIPPIHFFEDNIFKKVHKEVNILYMSGVLLHKSCNFQGAIQRFRKAVGIWYKCQLASEKEEKIQTKSLIKLLTNLAICYNKNKQPFKACTACNELNRLNNLWNNEKVLFQNAKALKMIGQFDDAAKRLRRAAKLNPCNNEIKEELIVLQKTQESFNDVRIKTMFTETASTSFKDEVKKLLKNFKETEDICNLTLPAGLNSAEIEYIQEMCLKENLFCNKVKESYLLDKELLTSDEESDINI